MSTFPVTSVTLIAKIKDLAPGEDSDISPFDNLRFGDADSMQAGDDQPLRMMFEAALEKLQDAAEK